jgi:hypothetical protein
VISTGLELEQHLRRLNDRAASSPCIVIVEDIRERVLAIGLTGVEASLSITPSSAGESPDEVFLRGDVERTGTTDLMLLGAHHSPVLNELLVPFELVVLAACEFFDTGQLAAAAPWEHGAA